MEEATRAYLYYSTTTTTTTTTNLKPMMMERDDEQWVVTLFGMVKLKYTRPSQGRRWSSK